MDSASYLNRILEKMSVTYLCLPKLISSDEIAVYEIFKQEMRCENISIRLIDGKELILRITEAGWPSCNPRLFRSRLRSQQPSAAYTGIHIFFFS